MSTTEHLANILSNPELHPYLRISAAAELGNFDQKVIPPLAKALQHDPDMMVRVVAAQSLRRIGTLDALAVINPLFSATEDNAIQVRYAALQEIAKLIKKCSTSDDLDQIEHAISLVEHWMEQKGSQRSVDYCKSLKKDVETRRQQFTPIGHGLLIEDTPKPPARSVPPPIPAAAPTKIKVNH